MLVLKDTMTSREIAELSGKEHKNVLAAIREMEPAWVKLGQLNFKLTSYTDKSNRQSAMYELTKTECLYIATKFNDEARAKLILRWEELEIKLRTSTTPLHYRRQAQHAAKVPVGYFSMVSEMCAVFIAPLEEAGAPIEELDKIIPDISLGRMFCGWLRNNGHDPDTLPTYDHKTPSGITVKAKLYPEELIPSFRNFVRQSWIPAKANTYLSEKAPTLTHYLPKLLTF